MPRVKIDYVVSFSSEDPDNPAKNLLELEVSKKKWLCKKGELSCSVVLQLAKAVKISSVVIGAYHVAMVEVLVGRSEKPNDPFEVLVPSHVLLFPYECRRSVGLDRVRSWGRDQLQASTRAGRWDRVRIVCSQPYNSRTQYGLSFIRIEESEGTSAPAVPPRLLDAATFSSDDEEFKPGELFSQRSSQSDSQKSLEEGSQKQQASTVSQIKKASSHALKNIPDNTTNLNRRDNLTTTTTTSTTTQGLKQHMPRQRDRVMYDPEDEQPHDKIDRIVNRHKDEKAMASKEDKPSKKEDGKDKPNLTPKVKDKKDNVLGTPQTDRHTNSPRNQKDNSKTTQSHRKTQRDQKQRNDNRKLTVSSEKKKNTDVKLKAGPVSSTPHTLLSDVVFVLSGYENPRRAQLRQTAASLGARYDRLWGPHCTHLICAYSNTPKLKEVRACPDGVGVPVVRGEWLEGCAGERRRLPWQWYATEERHRVHRDDGDGDDDDDDAPDSEEAADTDDEIEKVIQKQNEAKTTPDTANKRQSSPTWEQNNSKKHKSGDEVDGDDGSDVEFVCDERVKGTLTVDSDSDQTEVEDNSDIEHTIDEDKSLPSLFEGMTFVVDISDSELAARCTRYIQAYGGLVLQKSHLDQDSKVDYVLSDAETEINAGQQVTTEWLWKCHQHRKLCKT